MNHWELWKWELLARTCKKGRLSLMQIPNLPLLAEIFATLCLCWPGVKSEKDAWTGHAAFAKAKLIFSNQHSHRVRFCLYVQARIPYGIVIILCLDHSDALRAYSSLAATPRLEGHVSNSFIMYFCAERSGDAHGCAIHGQPNL